MQGDKYSISKLYDEHYKSGSITVEFIKFFEPFMDIPSIKKFVDKMNLSGTNDSILLHGIDFREYSTITVSLSDFSEREWIFSQSEEKNETNLMFKTPKTLNFCPSEYVFSISNRNPAKIKKLIFNNFSFLFKFDEIYNFSPELETAIFIRCNFNDSVLGKFFAVYENTNIPVFSKLKKIIIIDSVIEDEQVKLGITTEDLNFYSTHAKTLGVELFIV